MAAKGHSEGIGWVAAAVALAVGVRVLLAFVYEPLYGNDAPTYAALAGMIRTGDFTGYDGVRTPGYPVFMLLAGLNNQAIRLAQNISGLLAIGLAFLLVRRHGSVPAAGGVALVLALSIQFPFYEALIQTESLALAVLLASVFFLLARPAGPSWHLLVAGTLAAAGALVRPHFLFLPPLYAGLLLLRDWGQWRVLAKGLAALLIPAVLMIGGWMGFNHQTLGRMTFTSIGKISVLAHMIPYVESADESFGALKQIYVEEYRTLKDFMVASGDNRGFYGTDLQRRLSAAGCDLDANAVIDWQYAMAMDLIRKHPLGYLEHVVKAWGRFWRVHIIIYEECFAGRQRLHAAAWAFWRPVKLFWLGLQLLFLGLLPAVFRLPMQRERRHVLLTLYAVVLAACTSQSLTSYYDNARFAVPFLPLVAIAVAILACAWKDRTVAASAIPPLPGRNQPCKEIPG
jgi:4-amino-4-deoxy-L-arabinose transferase-like glycosyltransferase